MTNIKIIKATLRCGLVAINEMKVLFKYNFFGINGKRYRRTAWKIKLCARVYQ